MVFAMVEFGRIIMVQQVLANTSREGGHLAVMDDSTAADAKGKVRACLTAATLPAVDPVISPADPASAGYGAPVSGMVQLSFSQVSWLPTPMFVSRSTQLTTKTVVRREAVQ